MGDFCGGLISRYASTITAVITAQAMGLAGALVLLPLSGESGPSFESVAFAAAAGGIGVTGLAFFYYALSRGSMGVIAPLAALIGAGVPVLLAMYNGEQISFTRLAGIGLALVAVVLISLPGGEASSTERRNVRIDRTELPLVVLSGLGFAGFFVFMGHATAQDGVFWPLVVARSAGVALAALGLGFALTRRGGTSLRQRGAALLGLARLRTWPSGRFALAATFLLAGVGDLGGNVFFVLARQNDLVSVAVVLSSLYPVITTILAVVVLRERLRPWQVAGVALATLGVVLLSNAF